MLNLLEKALEEWTGRSQDHLVCFHLVTILTSQSHISEVIVISQTPKVKMTGGTPEVRSDKRFTLLTFNI